MAHIIPWIVFHFKNVHIQTQKSLNITQLLILQIWDIWLSDTEPVTLSLLQVFLCFTPLNIKLNMLQNVNIYRIKVRMCRTGVFFSTYKMFSHSCLLNSQIQEKIFAINWYFHRYIESCRLAIQILLLFIIFTTWNHNSVIPASQISEYKCWCHDPGCRWCFGECFLTLFKAPGRLQEGSRWSSGSTSASLHMRLIVCNQRWSFKDHLRVFIRLSSKQ